MTKRNIGALAPAALVIFLAGAALAGDTASSSAVWLGVFVEDLDGGVELVGVVPGGPADRQGLRRGDILVRVDGRALARLSDLEEVLRPLSPGDRIVLELLRGGEPQEVGLRVGGRESAAAGAPAPCAPENACGASAVGWRLADVTPDLRRHFGAPEEAGVLVTGILEGQSAAAGGLRVGDVLVALGEQPVRSVQDVAEVLGDQAGDGHRLRVSVVRGREAQALTLTLPAFHGVAPGEAPAPALLAVAPQPPLDRAALERVIRAEIVRLERRIEELRRELRELTD